MCVSPVRATPVTVGNTTYDITVQTLTFNQQSAQNILTSTAWWGDQQLALDLAAAVGNSLGTSNTWYQNGEGPFFTFGGLGGSDAFSAVWLGGSTSVTAFSVDYLPARFAVGTISSSSASVPDASGSLALLGSGLVALAALHRRFGRA